MVTSTFRRYFEPLLRPARYRCTFVLLGLVVAHIIALHEVGSNNPDGVEIKKNKTKTVFRDGIHSILTPVKDILGVVFLIVFCSVLFFAPEGGYFLEAPNFDAANA